MPHPISNGSRQARKEIVNAQSVAHRESPVLCGPTPVTQTDLMTLPHRTRRVPEQSPPRGRFLCLDAIPGRSASLHRISNCAREPAAHGIDPSAMTPLPYRPPASIYVAGLFAMGYTEFYIFLIPLYALSLGMSAGEVGMLVGGRSLLAVFLSIHVGVLMDRLGTRRVTLFFVWTAMALAPIFPLVPWFWALLLVQLVNGGALSFAWSGSQTLIAQLTEGEAEYIGRFSFFARIGTTATPMLAGIAWDCGGAWPSYMLGFTW